MTNAIQKRNAISPKSFDVVDSIFNNTLRRFFDGNFWDVETMDSRNSVPVNVRETDEYYEVDVIAPGVNKSDFSVKVQDNELQISFTHNEEKKQADEQAGWVRNEYVLQSFRRHFTLDDKVDTDNITASYVDGILRIKLPKTEQAKPKMLMVEVK